MKLDIACGHNKRTGFKGVDIAGVPEVDYVWNLEKYPWEPFEDNSIEEVYVSHYAEHARDLIQFMDEVWRICKANAKVTIIGPYYSSILAWRDPTHVRALSEETWPYFNQEWRKANKLEHYSIKSNYNIDKIRFTYNPPWDKKPEEVKRLARVYYLNTVSDILTELRVIKGDNILHRPHASLGYEPNINYHDAQIQKLSNTISPMEEIQQIERAKLELEQELASIKASRGWKIISFLHKLRIYIPFLRDL